MLQNIEYLKKLLDDAPKKPKATHVDFNNHYWHNSTAGYWLCCDDGSTCAGSVGNHVKALVDIEAIVKAHELLDCLLKLHDNEVLVAEPWNNTFEEVRKLLNG